MTVEVYTLSLKERTKLKGLLEVVSSSAEFETIPTRRHEESLLQRLASGMPQLETLILHSATPLALHAAPLISQPSRAATLPSLTGFHISASAGDCALTLAHLVLHALGWLHVDASFIPDADTPSV